MLLENGLKNYGCLSCSVPPFPLPPISPIFLPPPLPPGLQRTPARHLLRGEFPRVAEEEFVEVSEREKRAAATHVQMRAQGEQIGAQRGQRRLLGK